MNTRERVLKEALNCVNGEREKQYGNPEDNFRRIADLWSVYLTSLFEDEKIVVDIDPIDVAKMMILFKIARSNGDKDKLDNYIDILGYGACAAEIFECSEKAEKVLKKKEELGVQLADECKDCDYAEKCIGTGVCLKETEEKCVENGNKEENKERNGNIVKIFGIPIEKFDESEDSYQYFMKKNFGKEAQQCAESMKVFGGNGDGKEACENILDNFADLVNARVRKKTEEKELIKDKPDDKCNRTKSNPPKNKYTLWQAFNSISARISISSSRANVNPFDVIDLLIRNNNAPTDMATLLIAGKLNFDTVIHYIEDAIHEVKNGYK